MKKISDHISYKEATYSRTALRLDIKNKPNKQQLNNMVKLAEEVFEPLRIYANGPIKINSFFRSPELNKAICGSTKSQHCNGQAIDIDYTYGHLSNAEMFNFIKEHLDFDQMIWEFGDDDTPDWVHVSYVSPSKNRNRCLKAYKEYGKTKYAVI